MTGGRWASFECALLLGGIMVFAMRPAGAGAVGPPFTVGVLPQATGVTYGAAAQGRNEDVEPGIGVGGDGVIWIGSDEDVITSADPRTAGGQLSGEDIWKSTDGGQTFHWVAAPFNTTNQTAGLGGGDSDLAVAPVANGNGHYNVYATSLYTASSNLAYSQDGGDTWTVMTLGGIPAQDRPWVTASGACTFYLTFHQQPLFAPVVNRYDACNVGDVGAGFTLNPAQSTSVFLSNTAPGFTNAFGKPVVDNSPASPFEHNVYVPMEACNLQSPQDFYGNAVTIVDGTSDCPAGVDTETEIAVSADGGRTFDDYPVALNSNGEQVVWPTSLAVTADGTLTVVWSDNHHALVATSTNAGRTWSTPRQLDSHPLGTAVYPTAAALGGTVELAYYATTAAGDANDPVAMGSPGSPSAAPWRLYVQTSTNRGAQFTAPTPVTGVIHTGVLCTEGGSCSIAGSRDLYDDFGMTISPTTGRATIAFDADEPLTGAPAPSAVDPYTAYATELPSAPSSTPESPVAAMLVLGGMVATAVASILRARRRVVRSV